MSSHAASANGLPSPLHQFEVHPWIDLEWGGFDFSFTNAAGFMILSVLASLAFFIFSSQKTTLVPSRLQVAAELLFKTVQGLVRDNAGKEGLAYFPFVFTLFLFILGANLTGMIPYTYTATSQIIVTFVLAMMVFFLITVVAIVRHGFGFFSYFVPHGVPKFLLPLIVPVEIISYLSRPVSLSVRLFANMMAGHTMLKVFAGFTILMGIGGIAPLALNVVLTVFELMVAILQAYVFTVLTCLYLHDAIHLH